MNKHFKCISLLMALSLLIGLLAACGSTAPSESTAPAEGSVQAETQDPAQQETEAASAEPDQNEPEDSASTDEEEVPQEPEKPQVSYPLTTNGETLKYFIAFDSNWGEYVDGWDKHPAFLQAEEDTGVHIDFQQISASAYETQFNLMVASGDYPDLIDGFETNYASGVDNAIEEGIIIDLADMMEEYAPNYLAILQEHPGTEKDTRTDSGSVGSLYSLKHGGSGPMIGAFTRQDWLDEQGLSAPETYEEYEDMLLTFKDAYGCTSGLYITKTGVPNDDWLATGYGVKLGGGMTGPWYVEDGVVKCGFLEDGLIDYVTMMNRWYQEGLLSSDFISIEDTMFAPSAAAAIQEGDAAVWYSFFRQDNSWGDNSSDPDFEAVAIADAVQNKGDIIPFGNNDSIVDRAGTAISTACEAPELALQWLDFWYSDQGVILSNYGVEGVSYVLDDNDEPQLTELITNNPDGASQTAMMYAYTLQVPSFYDTTRTQSVDFGDRSAWAANRTSDNDYPTYVTMTAEEGSLFSATYSDIQTYTQEMLAKYIIGDAPLDQLSDFQDTIRSMGIDTCLEIKQAAYNRYAER